MFSMRKRLTKEEFVEKAKRIHGNKYDYEAIEYIDIKTEVLIYCKTCQEYFKQKPRSHLAGNGCANCNGRKYTTKKFISLLEKVFENKYIYFGDNFKSNTKIKVLCKIHNIFFFKRIDHLLEGSGCPICLKEKITKTSEEFIKQANSIHNNKYDYSQIEYINNRKKIKIFCKEHNEYFWQLPSNHLKGKVGCKYCIPKSKGENIIKDWLIMKGIKFEFQKRFKNCKDKQLLSFDFYLPEYNLCIEFQGSQHFNPAMQITRAKSKEKGLAWFKLQQYHDKIKKEYCKQNGIKFLEITYKEDIVVKLNTILD